MSSTTVHTAMKQNGRKAYAGAAVTIGVIAYLGGILYAGVRSFDLFARTLPADMLMLAAVGIVALELSLVGLPLAIHYWLAPGAQRMAGLGFYVLDLLLVAANAILDSAQIAGHLMPGFMQGYGVYVVPALPILIMVCWATLWSLDPTSKEHDMIMAVRAATQEAVLAQVVEEARSTDITDLVRDAAGNRAREIVGETLGGSGSPRLPAPAPAPMTVQNGGTRPAAVDAGTLAALLAALQAKESAAQYNADAPEAPDLEPVTVRRSRNGAGPHPKV